MSYDEPTKKWIMQWIFGIPMTKKIREDMATMSALRFAFEDEAEKRGEKRGKELMLFSLVSEGVITVKQAAKAIGMSKKKFRHAMEKR